MKTERVLCVSLLLLSVVLTSTTLVGQTIGKPVGTALFPIEHGFIDLASGNVHLEIPIEGYKQRGNVQAPASFVYDSSIWTSDIDTATGTGTWQPNGVTDIAGYVGETTNAGWRFNYMPGGTVTVGVLGGANGGFPCVLPDGQTETVWYSYGFTWYDFSGTPHLFPIVTFNLNALGCTNASTYNMVDTPSGSAYAQDGSGFYATVTNYTELTVWDPNGTQVFSQVPGSEYGANQVDRNGNCLGCIVSGDTLGRNPIKITVGQRDSNGNALVEYYDVTTTAGAVARYTITYESISLNTSFGHVLTPGRYYISMSEFAGSTMTIASIGLPDGTSYGFSYENGTYGELTGITLPHGGSVSLSYTNPATATNGIWSMPARPVTSYTGSKGTTSFDLSLFSTQALSANVNCEITTNLVINHPSKVSYSFENCGTAGARDFSEAYYQSDTSSTVVSAVARSWQGSYLQSIAQYLVDGGQYALTWYTYPTSFGPGIPSSVQQWDFSATPSGANMYGTFISSPQKPSSLPTREIDQVLGYNVNGATFPTAVTYKDQTGTAISEMTYAYDEPGHLVAAPSTTPNLVSVSGNRGNLTTLTAIDPTQSSSTNHISSFYYDTAGKIQSVKDPKGYITSFTYDSTDTFPIKTIAPPTGGVAHETSKTFDLNTGQVKSYTDQNNQTSTYNYDDLGRLQSVVFSNAGSPITLSSFQYPSANETDVTIQQSSTSSVSVSKFTDGYGRKSKTTQSGVSTEWTYDSHGRLYSVTNPHSGAASLTDGTSYFTYDELDRILNVTNPLGQSINYSYLGNTQTITDPLGHQRGLTFDSFGDLTSVVEPNSSNTLSWTTIYQYNGLGQLASVNQQGGTTSTSQWRTRSFKHNGFGYLASQTTPEAGAATFNYDNNGNLTSSTDARGLSTSYSYDALNRVTSKTIQNGSTHTYSYDAQDSSGDQFGMGMLTHIGNGSNVQANFTHNPLGYLTSETYCLPSNCANTYVATAGTDNLGNVTSLTYPDGRALSMTYNALNQLTSESWSSWNGTPESVAYLYGVTYYPPGEVATATYGNGVSLKATYDANQNIRTLGYAKSEAVVSCKAYSWQSNAANLQSITDEVPGVTRTFSYDQLDRLQSVSDSGGSNPLSESYSFDAWGNLQQSGNFSFVQAFGANNQVSTGGYGYDAAGNLLSEPSPISNSFSFGADGLLTGSNGAAYTYDSFGQRVRKDNGSTSQEYFYFGGGLLGMRNASTGTWTDHIYGAGRFIASVAGTSSATPTWRVGDHLDSLSYQTDSNGSVLSSTSVTPFGQLASDTSGDAFPFTDHERDSENGTDHTLYRHYSPGLGRWLSPDPSNGSYSLTDPQSLNRYSYLTNRPMKSVDALGLDDDDDDDDDSGGGCQPGDSSCNPFPTDTSQVPLTSQLDLSSIPGVIDVTLSTGGNAAIADAVSSLDSAPGVVGENPTASGSGGDSIAGDVLLGGLMLLGNVPEVGTFANAALAGYYLAKGQYGQAALFGGAAIYSTFGGVGGSEIAEGVEALRAAETIGETALEASAETTAEASGEAFHYTASQNVTSIMENGLRPGSYATTAGDLSPMQAQLDLALPPNRGLPNSLIKIDLEGLSNAGYEIPDVNQVGRMFNMPGGGSEMQFPYPIPSQFLQVIR